MYFFRQGTRNTRENLVIRFWVKVISLSVAAALRVFDQTSMHDPAIRHDETYWHEPMGSSLCFYEISIETAEIVLLTFSRSARMRATRGMQTVVYDTPRGFRKYCA